MQQPPNPYPQQWQQPSKPLPPEQQWQQQTNYGQPQSYYPPPPQQQQWYQPDFTQPPIERPKRNRVVLWVSGGIICVVLAVLVVVGSVLIGYSFFFSPNHSGETIFTSTQYPTLYAKYSGTYTDSPVTPNASTIPVAMGLIITSNDNQGHISGRVGILDAPNGGDPFIGTLGVNKTITFTATPLLIGVLTVFTGNIHSDGSISGTTSNYMYQPASWKLFPVKGQ